MGQITRTWLAVLAVLLVVGSGAAADVWQRDQFDPTGAWEGPCTSKGQSMGTLRVEFRRDGRAWRAKGGLRTPGYPSSDSEFQEVSVDGAKVAFVGLWGPTIGEFAGTYQDRKLVGELKVVQDEKTVMSCAWTLSKLS